MIFDIMEARDILRLDGVDNDAIIMPLVDAIEPYIAVTTGYKPKTGKEVNPIAKAIGQFLLKLWYYGEDVEKLQRAIDCLSKALAATQATTATTAE